MRTALADPAISNDFVFAADALGAVKLLQLIGALERPIFVRCGGAPRDSFALRLGS